MIIELLRVDSTHVYAYKPGGETKATVTGIFWDKKNKRPAVSLLYDNGETDWIPISELNVFNNPPLNEPAYSVINKP